MKVSGLRGGKQETVGMFVEDDMRAVQLKIQIQDKQHWTSIKAKHVISAYPICLWLFWHKEVFS